MGDDRSAVSTGVGEECLPLKTLEELLNFDGKKLAPSSAIEPLRDRVRTPDGPRTLLCHDMMGGYLEDRFLQGSSKSDSYRFHHWHLIDTFVYFSHYLVTIPPAAWINAAHKHGVKVLGTFITEWESGTKILEEVRNSQATQKVATQLASVAAAHGFDGWLINIESALGEDCGPFLEVLLSAITAETHRAVPGSEVLWYDSILASGKLDWQNELNELNGRFFDRCDGIFLNYGWTEEHFERSARFAGDRRWDVYVGVDVWARKTKYAGGYDTYKAVAAARKHGLSAAIFAPGWVFEMEDRALFTENQYRLWNFPSCCSRRCKFTTLPISTTFCQGFGKKAFQDGKVVKNEGWFNLSRQELQPLDQGQGLCDGHGSAMICVEDGFSGGGCLRLEFKPTDDTPQKEPYFRMVNLLFNLELYGKYGDITNEPLRKRGRLFECELPLEALRVSYTFKPTAVADDTADDEEDLALVLKLRGENGRCDLILGSSSIDGTDRISVRRISENTLENSSDGPHNGWCTRTYLVQHTGCVQPSASVEEIGVQFSNKRRHQCCLLGRLVVERPKSARREPEDLTIAAKRRRLEEPQAS